MIIPRNIKASIISKARTIVNLALNREAWIRSKVHYPTLHYRYSYDIANVLELRAVGVRARSGRVILRWRLMIYTTAILIAPLTLAGILAFADANRPPRHLAVSYFGWLVYFTFLNILEIAMAWAGVTVFHELTDSLEKLLTQKGLDTYYRWANIATASMPQLVFSVMFSIAACGALWIAASVHGMTSRLYIATPLYMAIAVSGFFMSQGMYWVVGGTVLSVLLTRPGHMQPSWRTPAYTPGVELLARCYRLGFYGTSIGVALCLFPLLTWVYNGPRSVSLMIVKIGLFIVSITAALLIAVIPQWRLSAIVGHQRRLSIEKLESLTPTDMNVIIPGKKSDQTVIAWLQLVSSSPSTTVQSSTIAGVLLGLATAVLPYIIRMVN